MQTPILLIAWQRMDTLRQVIKVLRSVEPMNIYIACDGPKDGDLEHKRSVSEVRQLIDHEIDWECKINKLYSERNQGCRLGVSRAISWFFEQVEEGVILEDDCVPHTDFFAYSSELLERFRNERRVSCISGSNFQHGRRRGDGSYYFSKYPHCWGWATWKRSWQQYSGDINFWPDWKRSKEWSLFTSDPRERKYWEAIFDRCYNGSVDSWAYPWAASVWKFGGLTAIPQVNLVQNIGIGNGATHTSCENAALSVPSQPLTNMRHPSEVQVDSEADAYVFETVFCGDNEAPAKQKKPHLNRLISRVLKWLTRRV
jgi:hypothetical protein